LYCVSVYKVITETTMTGMTQICGIFGFSIQVRFFTGVSKSVIKHSCNVCLNVSHNKNICWLELKQAKSSGFSCLNDNLLRIHP